MNLIKKGTTSVTRYMKLIDSSAGTPKTGYTIANLDLQYTRNQSAPSAKADATALAATSSAFSANKAIEIDSSFSPGLYRIDWPDAAFATGVDKVILCVTGSGVDPAFEEIQLVDNMPGELNTTTIDAVVDATWDEGNAAHVAAGSTGKSLSDASAAAANTASVVADAVWEEHLADHSGTAGSTAAALAAIGDPWSISLPGAYASGTAGFIIGTNLDVQVTTRARQSDMLLVKAQTDSLTFSAAGIVDANIQYVNNVEVAGTGNLGDEWRPV